MSLSATAIAVEGVGFGANVLAMVGWVSPQAVVPVTPVVVKRPKPKQEPQPYNTASGGNAVFLDVINPAWTGFTIVREEEDDFADFALIHAPEVVEERGAAIKALADGVAETFIDSKGRRAIVLNGNDGTRYWYADIGEALIENGAQVRAGELIGRTKQGAPSLPAISSPPKLAAHATLPALPVSDEERKPARPKRVQPVFVEPAPLPVVEIQPVLASPPRRRIVRLVPIRPLPQKTVFLDEAVQVPVRGASSVGPAAVVAVAALTVVAAAVYVVVKTGARRKAKPKKKKRGTARRPKRGGAGRGSSSRSRRR
jgi:hypothetical protein